MADRMTNGRRLQAACAALLATSLSVAASAAAEEAGAGGSWQRHELRFQYQGFTSIYSCDGLVDKLRVLLKAAGAREDFKVTASACTELGGQPDRFASAKLVYHTLQPAKADATDGLPAQWRNVRLVDGRPLDLAQGDCELVEQFRDALLRKTFAIRNLQDQVRCVPHQGNQHFRLEFEVLAPVSPGATGTPR